MTSTPHRIFKELGVERFEDYLTLLYITWNGDKNFLSRDFMNGFYEFYKAYRDDIDVKIFKKRLSIFNKNDIDNALSMNGKDKSRKIAIKIFQKYNKNKRIYPNNTLDEKGFFFME